MKTDAGGLQLWNAGSDTCFGEGLAVGTWQIGMIFPGTSTTNSAVCANVVFLRPHSTGKERDTESGNDYFGARYYASTMGRFLSPDWSTKAEPVPYAKLDDPQSLNLYAYVRNNPLTRVDADGHVDWDKLWNGVRNAVQSFTVKAGIGLGFEYGVETKGFGKKATAGAKVGGSVKAEYSISKKGLGAGVKAEIGGEAHLGTAKAKVEPSVTVTGAKDGEFVNPKNAVSTDPHPVELSANGASVNTNGEIGITTTATIPETPIVVEVGVSTDTHELSNAGHEIWEGLTTTPKNP